MIGAQMGENIQSRSKLRQRGRLFEDFFVGQKFDHHWGRTITESDTTLFTTLTLSFNPLYFNKQYAIVHGMPDIVVNPQLVFNVTFGLSVEDLSEIGGPFLGVFDLVYHRQVHPGVTLRACSETVEARLSSSNPQNGIVSWWTEGFNDAGERIISFRRSNLVRRREGGEDL
jgi:itaconyl-CoA hydratase